MQMGNKMILPSSLGSQLSFLPIFILPPFSPFMAMLKPCPSVPSRLPTGTTQSSKITARVGWEFQPTWEKTEHLPDCLRSSTPPAPSREPPSLLSTPRSHCQAAAEHLSSTWFGLSVLSWKLECMYLRRGTDPTNINVPEIKMLHLPKGRVLGKLHQSWTWLGKTTPGWDSGPIQEEISNALHGRAHLSSCTSLKHTGSKNQASYLLLFLAKAEAWRPLLQHQAGDALGAWASCATHDHVYIGITSPADEGLQKDTRRKGWLSYANPEPAAAAGVQRQRGKDPTARRYLGTQLY